MELTIIFYLVELIGDKIVFSCSEKYNNWFGSVENYQNNGVPLLLKLAQGIFCIFQSFEFCRENYIISSILSVLSCYITSIELIFHIHGTCTIQSFENVVLCNLEAFQLSTITGGRGSAMWSSTESYVCPRPPWLSSDNFI